MILIANLFVCALLLMAVVALYFFVSLWMDRSNASVDLDYDEKAWTCNACGTMHSGDVKPLEYEVDSWSDAYVQVCPGECTWRRKLDPAHYTK